MREYSNINDLRVRIYYTLKIIFIIILISFFVKNFVFLVIKVNGTQMEPTILKGDRLLIFKGCRIPIFGSLFIPSYNKIVLFTYGKTGKPTLLRIAAKSNDIIEIDSGIVYVNRNKPEKINSFSPPKTELIPFEYSPRDFFPPYKLPKKGDIIVFNKLSLRDFFFALEIIKQENPKKKIEVKPQLFFNDSVIRDYRIKNFSLYEGSLDSVPDTLNNWFFWSKVKEFLSYTNEKGNVFIYFSISLDNTPIDEYEIKDNYLFLLADHRKEGLDSRFIGPIRESICIGSPVMVLFSNGKDLFNKNKFRFKRIGRFII